MWVTFMQKNGKARAIKSNNKKIITNSFFLTIIATLDTRDTSALQICGVNADITSYAFEIV